MPALNTLDGAMFVAFERAVGVPVPTEKLDRVFLLLRMSSFGLRRSPSFVLTVLLDIAVEFPIPRRGASAVKRRLLAACPC